MLTTLNMWWLCFMVCYLGTEISLLLGFFFPKKSTFHWYLVALAKQAIECRSIFETVLWISFYLSKLWLLWGFRMDSQLSIIMKGFDNNERSVSSFFFYVCRICSLYSGLQKEIEVPEQNSLNSQLSGPHHSILLLRWPEVRSVIEMNIV